jgi:NADH:ubiquinone reductase (H+-translocating)
MAQHPRSAQTGRRHAKDGVLILGGGFAGSTVARELGCGSTIVSTEQAMLFTPMLPELASGSLEPRHVTVPLRLMCPRTELVIGSVTGHDPEAQIVTVDNEVGRLELSYTHLVVTLGSISRILPVPGLAEHAVGFKDFIDALFLRNHVLREVELADNEIAEHRQRPHLTFVFIGGGYAGVEALAELQDMVRDALRDHPDLQGVPQRWVLVEALDRILSSIPPRLARYAAKLLAERGVEIHTGTKLAEVRADGVTLDTGETIEAHTVVWSAGVAPNPVVRELGLTTDDLGRLVVGSDLRVVGSEHVWAAGDCAAVPNAATPGRLDPPTSQHAIRQARRVAKNLIAAREGRPGEPYSYRALGQVATLGRYKGVAEVLGVRFSGFVGWFIARSYHLLALPLTSRRARVLADWTLALFFRRDVVAYGNLESAPTLERRHGQSAG